MSAPSSVRPRGRLSAGLRVGRIGGIPILVSWSWLLSVLVVAVLATPVVQQAVPGVGRGAAIAVAVVLGLLLGLSVLVHELGHCLAARALGLPVLQVRLYLLGGVSELGRSPASPREEAVVAAAGPGLSALLAGIFVLLIGSVELHTIGWLLLLELAFSNVIVAVFNVLPALPLDGGRVLRAGVWQVTGRRRWGTLSACIGGYLVAAGLIVWGGIVILGGDRAGFLQGAIALATAAFVALGAVSEQRADRATGPAPRGLAAAATPVVVLPLEISVELALQAAGTRAIILTGSDGRVAGLVDLTAARDALRVAPSRPALDLARPITATQVVLPDDDPAALLHTLQGPGPDPLVLIDDLGSPTAVITRALAHRILSDAPDRPATGSDPSAPQQQSQGPSDSPVPGGRESSGRAGH